MHTVIALRRYPLKSARGEAIEAVDVEAGGLRGDRIWACIDRVDGTVGSAKHPGRWGRLLEVAARLSDEGREPTVMVQVGGRPVRAGSADADAALSAHVGRPVRLSRDIPPGARLHRRLPDEVGMVPEWMDDVLPGQETITAMGGPGRPCRFVDFGAVHILTTGALSLLGRRMGGTDAAAGRFRPNLVVDAPHDPEPGQVLRLDEVVLRVISPTPRCVVPALEHAEVPPDRSVLTALARHYRIPVAGLGHAACFGTYADVVQPGTLRLGQFVR
jgi:uncharacterized protein YcbX